MAREKLWGSALGYRIRDRKEQLVRRDPLGKELSRLHREVCEAYASPPVPPAADLTWTACQHIKAQLESKYRTRIVIIHPQDWQAVTGERFPADWLDRESWDIAMSDRGLDAEQIMIAFPNFRLPFDFKAVPEFPMPTTGSGKPIEVSPPPNGAPPTVQFTVDLSAVTEHDLTALTRRFKSVIRQLRSMLPPDLRATPSQTERNPLAFVRTIKDEKFARYLQRYDRHFAEGLSFRQIASLEALKREGTKSSSAAVVRRRVGKLVPSEDSVEKSVKLIYQAIYRRPYTSRRRRLDTPAQGATTFSCPDHPKRDCSMSCKYLKDWLSKVEPTLPRPFTGRGLERLRRRPPRG